MQGTQVQNSHDPRLTPVGLCTHAVNDGINTTIYKMNVGSFHTHTHTHTLWKANNHDYSLKLSAYCKLDCNQNETRLF